MKLNAIVQGPKAGRFPQGVRNAIVKPFANSMPPFMQGLRVLIKDGVNIIVGGPVAISSNAQDAVTGAPLIVDVQFSFNGYETTWGSGSFLRNIKVPPLVYGDTNNITVAGWLDGSAVAVRLRNGVDSTSDAFLFVDKNSADVYTNVNNTSIKSGERALSGMTFFAYSINNSGEANFYLNTDVSGNPLTELRLVDSRTMTPPEPLSSDFMLLEARGTDPCSIYKYAIWDASLPLETLQSWFDLGPTADPF